MKLLTFVIIILAILIYGLINYFIGIKGLKLFKKIMPSLNQRFYWSIFWLVVYSFVLGKITSNIFPYQVNYFLTMLGYYWMVALEYFFITLFIIDLIKLIARLIFPNRIKIMKNESLAVYGGLLLILLVLIILIFGTINARSPVVKTYSLNINKTAGTLKNLNIVFISDMHIGQVVGYKRISNMVNSINNLKPDIVLIGGDTIDDDPTPFIKENIGSLFKKIKSKYGTYAVLGNHEYYAGKTNVIVNILSSGNIHVLRDKTIEISNSFYIVGRDDLESQRFGVLRKTIPMLLKNKNRNLPIIVLDHQPPRRTTPMSSEADLQLSGHTHAGQYFPNSVSTSLMYATHYGYLKRGSTNLIVTDGYGTWGPPIRLGNKPEIVLIKIKFK